MRVNVGFILAEKNLEKSTTIEYIASETCLSFKQKSRIVQKQK